MPIVWESSGRGEIPARPGSEPGDRDALVPVHVAHVDALAACLVDGIAREAPGEPPEGDTGLQPRQRRADAVMDSLAESQLRRDVAADVEAVGVGILALVAVGGPAHQGEAIPRRAA